MKKQVFDITGMSCSACSARVGKVVGALRGVADVSVSLLKNSMTVQYDDAVLTPDTIAAAMRKAGYGASPAVAGTRAQTQTDGLKRRLILSFVFMSGVLACSMGGAVADPFASGCAQAFFTALTVWVNRGCFIKGFATLFRGAPNMDSLIALGATAAVVYSACVLCLTGGEGGLYFESAAMVLTLIMLGRYLESRAKGKTAAAIEKLLTLAPQTAVVVRNGAERTVPASELKTGDLIVVKAGDKTAADGEIVEGRGVLDESAMTGESTPVSKQAGDTVLAAAVAVSGHFVMRARQVGSDTVLAQIVRLVDEATSSKAPIARLADKISGVFVPFVIIAAALTAAVWLLSGAAAGFAVSAGVSVLVVSCPCALGLATPTAIMVGAGRGAARGVLFKTAAALETAGRVTTVALDKTGTLTAGKPAVTDVEELDDRLAETLASLETMSGHPLGRAVIDWAGGRNAAARKVENFEQIDGQGIRGEIDGVPCCAGNARMMRAAGVDNMPEQTAEKWAASGRTPVFCAIGGKLLGAVGIADPVKPDAAAAVKALRAAGIKTVMLTGDNARTAAAVAAATGGDSFVAEMLPQDKEREIRRLRELGETVAMVGDGINDSPALARADVGLAVGSGTDIAVESADVVLMNGDLSSVVFALELGRAVLKNIKENLFWAFFYNLVCIPVAAGVFYPRFGVLFTPAVAAAAMSFSSFSVVTNALRLRRFAGGLKERKRNMKKIVVIEEMHCEHCAAAVVKALRAVDGVIDAAVDLKAKKADVETNGNVADETLAAAVDEAGFKTVCVTNA